MQTPRIPPNPRSGAHSPLGVRVAVALTVAAVLGGYTLALGFTGLPVVVAALSGIIAGLVLVEALAD